MVAYDYIQKIFCTACLALLIVKSIKFGPWTNILQDPCSRMFFSNELFILSIDVYYIYYDILLY